MKTAQTDSTKNESIRADDQLPTLHTKSPSKTTSTKNSRFASSCSTRQPPLPPHPRPPDHPRCAFDEAGTSLHPPHPWCYCASDASPHVPLFTCRDKNGLKICESLFGCGSGMAWQWNCLCSRADCAENYIHLIISHPAPTSNSWNWLYIYICMNI